MLWGLFLTLLALSLVVLVEISRSNRRREIGKMFATDKFNQKISALDLTSEERVFLERLARLSPFSNKDAVFNSPLLFEKAVNEIYAWNHGAENVSPSDRRAISSLRTRLGHLENAQRFSYVSSRQFSLGKNVSFYIVGGDDLPVAVHTQINFVDEVCWGVHLENPALAEPLVGKKIFIRLNIPGEAVYSAEVSAKEVRGDTLFFKHSVHLHKEQLRRWIRLAVKFPVHLKMEGMELDGTLVDLSAGGILLSLPAPVPENSLVFIRFELPGFGEETLQVRILRQLHGGKINEKTGGIDHSASFIGDFGEVQEHVLQYIFREREAQKNLNLSLRTV